MGSEAQFRERRDAVVLIANTSWYLWNFRRRLAEALKDAGFAVVFVAPQDAYSDRLREIGRFVPLRMSRGGKNPLRELVTILNIRKILRDERPGVVFTWTPKPNIYTGLVSRLSGTNVIPNVAGLGTLFVKQGWLSRLVGLMYRGAFRHLPTVFFQNHDDKNTFVAARWVAECSAQVLPGSGVDLQRFQATPLPGQEPMVFLYGGRLLREKGLPELVEAHRRLRAAGKIIVLRVYGHFDPGNPSAIDASEIEQWGEEGLIDYKGSTDSMETVIRDCDCVVLPSYYREGVPRILLEAAASGRPIITTDRVGCRDAIEAGKTGLMCEPRDAASLAAAMEKMMMFSPIGRERMAKAARKLAESKFDERIIVAKYLAAIKR